MFDNTQTIGQSSNPRAKALKLLKLSLRADTNEQRAAESVAREYCAKNALDLDALKVQAETELGLRVPPPPPWAGTERTAPTGPAYTYNRVGHDPVSEKHFRANGSQSVDDRKVDMRSPADRDLLASHIVALLLECGFELVAAPKHDEQVWAHDLADPTSTDHVIRIIVFTTIDASGAVRDYAGGTIRVQALRLDKRTGKAIGLVSSDSKLPAVKTHNLPTGTGKVRRCGFFGEFRVRLHDAMRRVTLAAQARVREI